MTRVSRTRRTVGAITLSVVSLAVAVTSPANAATRTDFFDDVPPAVAAAHSPDGFPAGSVGPELHTFPAARIHAETHLGAIPPGANIRGCTPAPGTQPVILIPGTAEDAYSNWAFMAPQLKARGLCVYSFNVNPALNTGLLTEVASFSGDIRASAKFLAGFVDQVLAETGADKVDLVGHSQGGGVLPMTYLKFYGGAAKVNHLVGITPSNHGTTMSGLATLATSMDIGFQAMAYQWAIAHNLTAFAQQAKGSSLMREVYADGDRVPGVKITTIVSKHDEVVTPWRVGQLEGATNVVVQNVCPLRPVMHAGAPYDSVVIQLTTNALLPQQAKRVSCVWVPPYVPKSKLGR